MSLTDFVFFLNSLTTVELHQQFPNTFNKLSSAYGVHETVKKSLANDAIMWRLVKHKAKKEVTYPC